MAAALVSGVAAGAFNPAQTSAIRSVVSTEDLPTALSQNQARQHVASLLGGPLGGALYAVTRWLPFAVDALTFAIACVTVSRVRTDLSAPHRRREPLRRQLTEGFAFIWARPFFRTLLVWASLTNLVTNAIFFVIVLRMVQEGVPAAQIGLVSTSAGVGGLLGAALAPSLIHRLPTGVLTVIIGWMCCLPLVPLTPVLQPVAGVRLHVLLPAPQPRRQRRDRLLPDGGHARTTCRVGSARPASSPRCRSCRWRRCSADGCSSTRAASPR